MAKHQVRRRAEYFRHRMAHAGHWCDRLGLQRRLASPGSAVVGRQSLGSRALPAAPRCSWRGPRCTSRRRFSPAPNSSVWNMNSGTKIVDSRGTPRYLDGHWKPVALRRYRPSRALRHVLYTMHTNNATDATQSGLAGDTAAPIVYGPCPALRCVTMPPPDHTPRRPPLAFRARTGAPVHQPG